jgi:plasmid stabilization system protein ParE
LEDIEAYIAVDNPSAGIDSVLRVIDSIRQLGGHPEMGCKRRIADTREWIIRRRRSSPLTAFATTPSRDARVAPREELAAATMSTDETRWVNTEAVGTRTSRPRTVPPLLQHATPDQAGSNAGEGGS